MNKEQLQAIETRIDMSTMGPWFGNSNDDHMDWVETISGWVICTLPYSQTITPRIANRDFIAHARSDVPALLAEVRRLNKAVDRLARVLGGSGLRTGGREWNATEWRAYAEREVADE